MDNLQPFVVFPDTHGHLLEVEGVISFCRQRGILQDHRLLFLGDYVDRGPNVKELMNLCVALQKEGNVFLAGNHEFVLRMALNTYHPNWEYWLGRWAVGHEDGTLQSYGVKLPSKDFFDDKTAWGKAIVELWWAMPDSHRDFLFGLPLFYETAEQIFVHAGLNLQPWEEQKLFLQGGDHGARGPEQVFSHKLAQTIVHGAEKMVVSGHQHFSKPTKTSKRLLLHCGVDYGGPLVAWVNDLDRFIIPTKKV